VKTTAQSWMLKLRARDSWVHILSCSLSRAYPRFSFLFFFNTVPHFKWPIWLCISLCCASKQRVDLFLHVLECLAASSKRRSTAPLRQRLRNAFWQRCALAGRRSSLTRRRKLLSGHCNSKRRSIPLSKCKRISACTQLRNGSGILDQGLQGR